jgi:hypothetical protein
MVGEIVDIEEDRPGNVLRNRARVSTGGVTPTGGSVASRMTVLGSSRRLASQEAATRGFIEISLEQNQGYRVLVRGGYVQPIFADDP